MKLPSKPKSLENLKETLLAKKAKDIDWKAGKAFCLVYYPGDERYKIIKEVYNLCLSENALNPTATPSMVELEMEVISMCADLLNGDDETRGHISSGGTESILLSILTARGWAKDHLPKESKPHVVVADSVHPAFMKGFHYFDLDYTVVPTRDDGRANPEAMEDAIRSNTVMIVGSAPSYPYGLIDPITELGAIALKHGILCHVDACVGGFINPFLQELGYPLPVWDFSVEGVTSISADLHKYGYSPKGASVILYKNAALRRYQYSVYTSWIGGIYASPTISGTRPGGPIAGAWAALKGIGREGYLEMAKVAMETTQKLRNGIEAVPELEIIGEPDMTILAFKSTKLDIFVLADELNKRGWHFERQQNPASIHLTVNYIHEQHADAFLQDLTECVKAAKKFKLNKLGNKMQVGLVKNLKKVLPEGSIAKLNKSQKPDLENNNTAAMYGMMGALAGTGDLEEIVLDFLDTINSPKL